MADSLRISQVWEVTSDLRGNVKLEFYAALCSLIEIGTFHFGTGFPMQIPILSSRTPLAVQLPL